MALKNCLVSNEENGKWEEKISWEMVLIRLGKVDIKLQTFKDSL